MNHISITRLHARIVAVLRARDTGVRAMLTAVAISALASFVVLTISKSWQDLFRDATEAYAWGMRFLGGYGHHPPMTGWIAGLWYRLFPASDWASYALSALTNGVSLAANYLIARRVLGQRRAALVTFALMLYPLYFGAKADHFNNYQVLLALLPLTVWLFLVAWEKRSVAAGAALGLAAAAAMLTIYSAAIGLAAIAVAALASPERRAFFASPAPYAAVLVFLVALSPHLFWILHGQTGSLVFAAHYVGALAPDRSEFFYLKQYVGTQVGMLAFVFGAIAIALAPRYRRAPRHDDVHAVARRHVIVIAAVLVVVPLIAAMVLSLPLQPDWGNSLFFLVPTAALSLWPGLVVSWRAVARAAVLAAGWATVMLVALPAYEAVNFRVRPGYISFMPESELAQEVTRRWHERFGTPLPYVISILEFASSLTFYSPDHPLMMIADDPRFSPWIDDPADLRRKGFAGVCQDGDKSCRTFLRSFSNGATADQFDVELARRAGSAIASPYRFHIELVPPSPGQ